MASQKLAKIDLLIHWLHFGKEGLNLELKVFPAPAQARPMVLAHGPWSWPMAHDPWSVAHSPWTMAHSHGPWARPWPMALAGRWPAVGKPLAWPRAIGHWPGRWVAGHWPGPLGLAPSELRWGNVGPGPSPGPRCSPGAWHYGPWAIVYSRLLLPGAPHPGEWVRLDIPRP